MDNGPIGIDVHGHAIPQAFLEEVAARGLAGVTVERSDGYVVTFPGGKPLRAIAGIMIDVESRLQWLTEQGMQHQLVAPWLDIHGQELSPGEGVGWVRALNDAMAEGVGQTDRLHAYATLHLGDASVAASELTRAMEELSMVGCMLPTQPQEGSLADQRFDALWEAASGLRAPVVLHPPTMAPSRHLFDMYPQFKGVFGRGLDTALAAAEMVVAGVFDRFPDLPLVLVHGGGLLPYQLGRFDREFGQGKDGVSIERLPSEYVAEFYFDSVLLSGPSMRLLFDIAGPDHVMIGSDYGAQPKERAGVSLTAGLDAARPEESTRSTVLHETAERLFPIPGGPG